MSQLRARSTSTKQKPSNLSDDRHPDTDTDTDSDDASSSPLVASSAPAAQALQRVQSMPQRAISQTLTSTANLANLLPTGTLLAFQLLTPLFTKNGACDAVTRPLTLLLLGLLSLSCFVASFTDSVKASDGRVYYGLATFKGMLVFDYPDPSGSGLPDLGKFRVRVMDWVHAVLSVLVFGVVALRDKNVLLCFYPQPPQAVQEVLDIVPVGIGMLCTMLFVVFPTRRHGIGYPVTPGK